MLLADHTKTKEVVVGEVAVEVTLMAVEVEVMAEEVVPSRMVATSITTSLEVIIQDPTITIGEGAVGVAGPHTTTKVQLKRVMPRPTLELLHNGTFSLCRMFLSSFCMGRWGGDVCRIA